MTQGIFVPSFDQLLRNTMERASPRIGTADRQSFDWSPYHRSLGEGALDDEDSMARIWHIGINLDDLTAKVAGLDSIEEKAQFLDGLLAGAHGHLGKEAWPDAKKEGHEVGLKSHNIAVDFHKRQSESGKRSAAQRKAIVATDDLTPGTPPMDTDNPQPGEHFGESTPLIINTNQCSTEVQPWLDVGSNTVEAKPQLNDLTIKRLNDINEVNDSTILPPLPPSGGKRRGKNRVSDVKLTDLRGGESQEWFDRTWRNWPSKARRWVDLGFGKGREEEFTVVKGSKAQAEKNWQRIVDSGVATPKELAYAASFYWESDNPKKGFIQLVSTFFGPDKATWREYIALAKETIKQEDQLTAMEM